MSVFINGFIIDATVQETHEFSSEVTEHPVENGADVTDNVRARPIRISLDCIVTDTPIGFIRDVRGADSLPSKDAYDMLVDIRNAREPVDIETSLGTFENMVLESLSIPRTPQNGDALRFTASFIQIQLVTNARTTVRTSSPRGQAGRNLGNRPTTFVEDVQTVRNVVDVSVSILLGQGQVVE